MPSRPSSPSCKLRRDPDCPVCSDAAVAAREAGRPLQVDGVGVDAPFAMTMTGRPARSRRRRAREHGLHPAGPARRTSAATSSSSSTATRSVGESSTPSSSSTRRSSGQLLTDDGELNRFVNVYVNGQDVRYLAGLDTPVAAARRGPPPAGDGRRLTDGRPRRLGRRRARRTRTPTRRWPARRPLRRHPRRDRPHAARRDPADVAEPGRPASSPSSRCSTRPGSVKDRVAEVPDRGPRGARAAPRRTRSSSSRRRATPGSRWR